MIILNKLKWVAGVLLIFLIVLTTNLLDKDNFTKLRNSVISIYEDRVVASDIIFDIAILMQEKEIAIATSDSSFMGGKNAEYNQKIQDLISRYEQTKLTSREQEVFIRLKDNFDQTIKLEQDLADQPDKTALFQRIDAVVHNLYNLSKIQLKEGERQMLMSNKTMETIDLFTKVEIIFLILMAVIIQVIILYKPGKN